MSSAGGGMPLDFRHPKTRRKDLEKAKCPNCGEMIRTLGDNSLCTHQAAGDICPGSRNPPAAPQKERQ